MDEITFLQLLVELDQHRKIIFRIVSIFSGIAQHATLCN